MAAEEKKCVEEEKNILIYVSSSGSFLSSCILVAELCEQRGGEGSGVSTQDPCAAGMETQLWLILCLRNCLSAKAELLRLWQRSCFSKK